MGHSTITGRSNPSSTWLARSLALRSVNHRSSSWAGPTGSQRCALSQRMACADLCRAFVGSSHWTELVTGRSSKPRRQSTMRCSVFLRTRASTGSCHRTWRDPHLRRRGPGRRPLLLLTRSSSILDLEAVGANEPIILCPANHSPPTLVAARSGTSGYEAVATCLASPEVRARTESVIAWRPQVA